MNIFKKIKKFFDRENAAREAGRSGLLLMAQLHELDKENSGLRDRLADQRFDPKEYKSLSGQLLDRENEIKKLRKQYDDLNEIHNRFLDEWAASLELRGGGKKLPIRTYDELKRRTGKDKPYE